LLYDEIVDITGPVAPNNYTLNIIIKGLNVSYHINLKETLNDGEIQNKENITKKLQTKFDLELKNVLEKLKERGITMDIISLNTVLESLTDQYRLEDAWSLFQNTKNLKPDNFTYLTLLKGIKKCQPEISSEWFNKVLHLLEEAKFNFCLDEGLIIYIIESSLRFNKYDKMDEFFNYVKDKNNVSEKIYTLMIKAYGKVFKLEKSLKIHKEMRKKGVTPSILSYSALLKCVMRCKKIEYIDRILEEMKVNNIQVDESIYFILINGYKNVRNYEKSLKYFDEALKNLSTVDTFLFNLALDCYVECYNIEKMEGLFSLMKDTTNNFPQPNIITYSLMLKGYARTGKKKEMIELYEVIRGTDEKLDEFLYNILMDCFAEVNDEENLNKVYQDMKKNGLKIGMVAYSLILKLNSNLGNTQKCVELYDDMVKGGIKPNAEIYNISLVHQLKASLIDQPINIMRKMIALKMDPEKKLFDMMIKACMEKGKDKEAFDFALNGLKNNFKYEDEIYDVLVENLLKNEKCKTQEKFDFLNRLNKEIKYKGIKLSQSASEKSSKFINQNKVVKPSLYNSNSLYSSVPSSAEGFNNNIANNQIIRGKECTPSSIPTEMSMNAAGDKADKKKKKKKNKNKNKTDDSKAPEVTYTEPSQSKFSEPKFNQNSYMSNSYYYNDDNYYCPKNYYSYNSNTEKSVYTSYKKQYTSNDFKRGEFCKK